MHRHSGLGMPKYNILIAGVLGLGARIQTFFVLICFVLHFSILKFIGQQLPLWEQLSLHFWCSS